MITVLIVIAVAVTGWVYAICRLVNRLSTLADRLVRLSQVGYVVLVSAPLVYALAVMELREYAHGLWGIEMRLAKQAPRAVSMVGVGVIVVLCELVRRPLELRFRRRRVGKAVELVNHYVEDDRRLYAGSRAWQARVAQMLSYVPGNHITELHVVHYQVHPLAARLPGKFRIVHLSDLHYAGWLPDAVAARIVRVVNELKADVIALTGDYVSTWRGAGKVQELVGSLRARAGVFYVCGNHDIWEGEERVHAMMGAVGCEHVGGRTVAVGVDGGTVYLAGTNRPWRRDQLSEVLRELPVGACCIVLSHHPDNVFWLRRARAALVLSGHTHGGQIALPRLGPLLVPSARGSAHAAGFIRYGETLLYINYGLGVVFPVRILCPPEVACFDLDPGGG
ncbi:MAG: metallophosphoesterase [bacterium]|nr:metallophosphoesterase [bacterium]